MNMALWTVQILLTLLFLSAGVIKILLYRKACQMWPWVRDFSRTSVTLIGILDLLAAAGLFVPMWTGILPWLTQLAALGSALLLVSAVILHLRRKETQDGIMNALFAVLAVFVWIGRMIWT